MSKSVAKQEEESPKHVSSVTDYLNSLVWDGTPRLDRWLIDCAGAEDSPYVRAVSRVMLVAAVRRARSPGCTFEHLPVLSGPQGSGKSSALRLLAIEDDWYSDDVKILESDTRQLMEATAGKWIVDAGELGDMSHNDVKQLKMYLSRSHDEARMIYQRERTRVPRQFVIVGTTSSVDYLRDTTGNRRYWPMAIKRFDLDRLRADRDQLWAEASVAEAAGEPLQLTAVKELP